MEDPTKILYQGDLVWFGTFRCRPWYPYFQHEEQIENGHLAVFPRTSVVITHAGGLPVLADPTVVMFYNKGQIYRRGKVSERGDLCEWFAFPPEVIVQAMRDYDPSAAERSETPFTFTHGPSNPHSYMVQRAVVEYVSQTDPPDRMLVEEMMLHVLASIVADACPRRDRHRHTPASCVRPSTRRAHIDQVQAARTLLATRYQERLTLDQIAAELHTSPYHLCRIFRQHTGRTIHQYLDQLRLRTALELVTESNNSLTDVAYELGYASHSHFTSAFHRTFSLPPSALRQPAPSQRLHDLRKILIA